jgi:hypothetical protein
MDPVYGLPPVALCNARWQPIIAITRPGLGAVVGVDSLISSQKVYGRRSFEDMELGAITT